jgi:hypothetical protein
MFKTDFGKEDFDGYHGLVVKIGSGSEEGAIKMAKAIDGCQYSEHSIERIYNPEQNIWVFVWPKGVSVDIQGILARASHFMQFWRVTTLALYIKGKTESNS